MKTLLSFVVGLLACALCTGVALAAQGDYLLKGGKAYRLTGGKEMPLKDCDVQSADTDAGLWSWILVDPAQSEAMKNSEGGVYFFQGKDKKPAGFLPIKEEAASCRLYFSPSGEKFLLSWGMEYIQHLSLYVIDKNKGFVKKAEFNVMGPAFWIDPHRFAFNSINVKKGARAKDKFDLWWTSAALYDSAVDELIILKEATATKDYTISGYDEANASFAIMESSVKDTKDWGDEEKITDTEISVPTPAAG
ncbi:MAG: hypothetical protein K6G15_11935 [Desulfovibrio sp.]|nr:hypothetical protein [Desulfovibrio sp.]